MIVKLNVLATNYNHSTFLMQLTIHFPLNRKYGIYQNWNTFEEC